ncbi:response regulator [candidate division GN15 bacterium]|nr:response regulator [candidate division GN15 bacterium]
MDSNHNERVLLVDDDPSLLAAISRRFRGKFDIDTAEGGHEGLEKIAKNGPYAVVISDMRMPEMNGIQFLARSAELAPDMVRIMLTGNADLETAMHAVNESNIYRFLMKPCHNDTMEWAIEAGIEQHRLIVAERILLGKTLRGAVKVLTDILSMVNPVAFSRTSRLKNYVGQLVRHLNLKRAWQYELAGMLSQIGCIGLPTDLLDKVYTGDEQTDEEQQMFGEHPSLAKDLLTRIPRLEVVAEMIASQDRPFRAYSIPGTNLPGDPAILGGLILKMVTDFDTLIASGHSKKRALATLEGQQGQYHPMLLQALHEVEVVDIEVQTKTVKLTDLNSSMILAEDIRTEKGMLVAAKGQQVTTSMRAVLRNYLTRREVPTEVRVAMPRRQQRPVSPSEQVSAS